MNIHDAWIIHTWIYKWIYKSWNCMNLLQLIIQNVRLHQGYGLMSRWEHLARWPRRRSHDGQPARSSGRQNVFLWGNSRKYCEGMKSMISDDIVVTQPKKRLTFKIDINDITGLTYYNCYNQYVFLGFLGVTSTSLLDIGVPTSSLRHGRRSWPHREVHPGI